MRWNVPKPLWFEKVVSWQLEHGRSGLPWQHTHDPYRVWLSEIMLQQTQVATVLDYYPRFLQAFPTVQALAAAPQDPVMALWSGLGYYSRARHLHACAQAVVREHGGQFPANAEALQTLPGIGPSTAAAIAAFCFGERVSILDGNVKRVLSRHWGVEQDVTTSAGHKALWALAQAQLPAQPSHADMVVYTQGLMDLGATVCKPRQPQCGACPAQSTCVALASGDPARLPLKMKRMVRRAEDWWLQVSVRADGAVWLTKRPSKGVWAGLYAFEHQADEAAALLPPQGALRHAKPQVHATVKHVLTHKDLMLHMVQWPVTDAFDEGNGGLWLHPLDDDSQVGLPAPLRSWLREVLWVA
jgi:A/G-specific adenine glycosylase